MIGTVQGYGRLGYGVLYTIPATYLYLFASGAVPSTTFIGPVTGKIATAILLLGSVYTAIWIHHVGRLIYGDTAGLESKRDKSVSLPHLVYFATGVEPDQLPDTTSEWTILRAAVSSDDFRPLIFLRFLPASLFLVYLVVAWGWLTRILFEGQGTVAIGALWLLLTVLLFRNRIVGYLPGYIPEESVDGLFEAEYIRIHKLIRDSREKRGKSPRISARKRPTRTPSNRYGDAHGKDDPKDRQ